jgi:hypothetical protein
MASLDRLRALVRGTGGSPSAAARPRELTYEPVDASGLPIDSREGPSSLEGATLVETAAGRVLVVDQVIHADAWHGRTPLDRSEVSPDDLACLLEPARSGMPSVAGCPPGGPVLFLDLETTRLNGGAGTVAFLVGCGWFEAGAFRTRQFVLPAFGAERAMLAAVAAVLAGCGGLVTYNGKTFDLPVMETRWLFQRMTPAWDELPHVDLLHLARRLWSRREDADAMVEQSGCRLVALERALLGVRRVGDVAGFEIPSRYFAFVRRGDSGVLAPVLHHNRLDLLSLGCLTARAVRLLREGAVAAGDGAELVALASEYARRGNEPAAEACFRQSLDRADVATGLRSEAVYGLARLLRRRRRHAEAAPLWHELARAASARAGLRAEAREALAVHYEHRDRDLELATQWARQIDTGTANRRRRDEVDKRLARLGRKLAVRDRRSAGRSLPLLPQ